MKALLAVGLLFAARPGSVALSMAASAATASDRPAGVLEVGKPARGWLLDPLVFRDADGSVRSRRLAEALRWLCAHRADGKKMSNLPRDEEIGDLQKLLEDALPGLPRAVAGVKIYFDRSRWGVELLWETADGGFSEAVGRFEPSLEPGSKELGLTLWTQTSHRVTSPAPPALPTRVAQYVGGARKLTPPFAADLAAAPPFGWAEVEMGEYLAPAEPAPCDGADLSSQFPQLGSRDQGDVGSCHIFASLAPLEAALFKLYGVHVRLSEADLFVRNKVRNREFWERGWLSEGGQAGADMTFALHNGVATAQFASYQDMRPRYKAERHVQQALLLKRVLTALIEDKPPVPVDVDGVEGAAVQHKLLGFSETTLDRERDIVLRALRPVSLEHLQYEDFDAGLSQRRDLVRYLCQGVPVAVSMDISGLPEWGQGQAQFSYHAFVIKGFRRTSVGLVFTTRNSWGDVASSVPAANPDIPESELSRVYAADVATVPSGAAVDPVVAAQLSELAACDPGTEPPMIAKRGRNRGRK